MLRVLYHIGKDTKYIANKQVCNRFFCPPPAGRRTQQKREEEQVESKDTYIIKVWTNSEDAQNRNIHITHRQDYNIIF